MGGHVVLFEIISAMPMGFFFKCVYHRWTIASWNSDLYVVSEVDFIQITEAISHKSVQITRIGNNWTFEQKAKTIQDISIASL